MVTITILKNIKIPINDNGSKITGFPSESDIMVKHYKNPIIKK